MPLPDFDAARRSASPRCPAPGSRPQRRSRTHENVTVKKEAVYLYLSSGLVIVGERLLSGAVTPSQSASRPGFCRARIRCESEPPGNASSSPGARLEAAGRPEPAAALAGAGEMFHEFTISYLLFRGAPSRRSPDAA